MKVAMKNFFRDYVSEFDKLTTDLPRAPVGIARSEAFAFCALCKMFDIDLVIDSGTGHGISTEYFARTLDYVITIDNHRYYDDSLKVSLVTLEEYDNVEFIIANSYQIIPTLLQTIKYKRCAIFFDGPKAQKAFKLANTLNIFFAGFHDIAPDSPNHMFFKEQNAILHTHDKWFLDEFSVLNKNRIVIKDFLNGPGTAFWKK